MCKNNLPITYCGSANDVPSESCLSMGMPLPVHIGSPITSFWLTSMSQRWYRVTSAAGQKKLFHFPQHPWDTHPEGSLLSGQKSTLRPSGQEEEEIQDNLMEGLADERCLASLQLCQPSQWSAKHGSLRPGGLSGSQMAPAQLPPDCDHTREPQGETLPAEPVSTEPWRH